MRLSKECKLLRENDTASDEYKQKKYRKYDFN